MGDPHICAIVVTDCISFVTTFLFQKSHQLTHFVVPPLPKKLTLFGDPDICFCCKDRDSNRAIRRIETVHRTVSAKFINEFGASCLLCFAQFTPPNKKQKAPKRAWTQCPSSFFNPSECNKLHPPSPLSVRSVLLHFVQRSPPETRTLYKGGKRLI